jgi:hypothetical protein
MDQIDTSRPDPSPDGMFSHRQILSPEQVSLQGIPSMGAVLREIGLCVAVALGIALLATIYVYVKG